MDVKRINDFVRNLDSAINITGITVYGVDDEGHSVKIDTEMLTNPKPTFTEASTRTNIVGSGESTTTLWGKVKKFFTDLKTVAFSGNYNDLNNTPEIKTVATTGVFSDLIDKNVSTGTVTFTEASSRTNIATGESQSTIFGKIKKFFTDLKAVAFSGSYNDLSNKPLSVESSKVKYTLSDNTTKLTLAQESDLFSKDYNDLTSKPSKNYVLGTDVPLITTESTSSAYYTIASDIVKGETYNVNFDIVVLSTITFSTQNPIYIYYNSGSFLWIISSGTYQAGEYHITKRISVPSTFNNPRFYITFNDSSVRGSVSVKNCRIERENDNGWRPNTSDERIYFTSDTVSGNITSGETLAVMMKKIAAKLNSL